MSSAKMTESSERKLASFPELICLTVKNSTQKGLCVRETETEGGRESRREIMEKAQVYLLFVTFCVWKPGGLETSLYGDPWGVLFP